MSVAVAVRASRRAARPELDTYMERRWPGGNSAARLFRAVAQITGVCLSRPRSVTSRNLSDKGRGCEKCLSEINKSDSLAI